MNDRGRRASRITGKSRRAAEPGTAYSGPIEDLTTTQWRDQVGSDMRTQVAFTAGEHTPVLVCIPTHELHLLPGDGGTSANSWAESLPKQRFQQVTDLRRLDEISVDMDWTIQLGRPSRPASAPQTVTLTGVVRGPSPSGTGVALFYQGQINTISEWIDEAKRRNKVVIVAKARDGAEDWAVAAHLNYPGA